MTESPGETQMHEYAVYPSQITVFCDKCGTEDTGDYTVHTSMSRSQRLGVARKHLVNSAGWKCDELDLCPDCQN